MKRFLRRTHALIKTAVAGKDIQALQRQRADLESKYADLAKRSKQRLAESTARKDEQIASLISLRDVYRSQIADLRADHTALTDYHVLLQEEFRKLQSHHQVARTFLRGKHWLRRVIADVAALHDYNSLTPGRADWAEKWRNPKGKRILYYAPRDHGASLYNWAEAVNRHTDHAARLVTLSRDGRDDPLDILYFRADAMIRNVPQMYHGLCRLAEEADIVHLRDERNATDGRGDLPISTFTQFAKPLVCTLDGDASGRPGSDASGRSQALSCQARVATTPDAWLAGDGSVFIPCAIDVEANAYQWVDGKLIVHAQPEPAGAETELLEGAAAKVGREFGTKVETLARPPRGATSGNLPRATLFLDRFSRIGDEPEARPVGWYGAAAIEAGAFGVPIVTCLPPDATDKAKQAGFDGVDDCPFLNTSPTAEGLYRTMRDFFAQTEAERREASLRTRKWIEDHHSYPATARRLDQLYRSL